jgi:predicted RND superfamily exporter protein
MNSVKYCLAKFARYVGVSVSHALAATVIGFASLASLLSLFMFDSGIMKLIGAIGFLILGYLVTLGLALLRGER